MMNNLEKDLHPLIIRLDGVHFPTTNNGACSPMYVHALAINAIHHNGPNESNVYINGIMFKVNMSCNAIKKIWSETLKYA